MARFTCSTTIKRPVEDVFTVLSNPANDPTWSSAVVEAEQTSPGPIGVGTTGPMTRPRHQRPHQLLEVVAFLTQLTILWVALRVRRSVSS